VNCHVCFPVLQGDCELKGWKIKKESNVKHSLRTILFAVLTFSLLVPGYGKDLEEILQDLVEENGKGYLGPVATAFGTGFNTGTFHTARPHKMLGFDVKLNIIGVSLPEAAETYEFYLPSDPMVLTFAVPGQGDVDVSLNFDEIYEQDRTTSTFFGPEEGYEVEVDEAAAEATIVSQIAAATPLSESDVRGLLGSEIAQAIDGLPSMGTPGFGLAGLLPGVPMIVPQVSVGLPMDIEVTLRGLPEIDFGDAGTMSFFGLGGKIGLNQFLPVPVPFLPRVSVGYYLTNLKFGDIFEAKNSITTLQVSKSIPFITVYGGFGLESSSMSVSYDAALNPADPTDLTNISFDLEGDNAFRTIVGVRLKLALLSINADYNIGEYPTLNIGLGVTLR
jgi:hypothetical protein